MEIAHAIASETAGELEVLPGELPHVGEPADLAPPAGDSCSLKMNSIASKKSFT